MKHLALGLALAAGLASPAAAEPVTVNLARFFGACEDAGTDTHTSVGEACIIQSIINAASQEIPDVTVKTLPTDWGNYYDHVKAMFAAGDPPDIFVIHRSSIPEFASLGALADIGPDLEAAGIDMSDWTEGAKKAVTYDGKIVAVPMDFHANLWHVNMDIMKKAGLVKDGKPILPHSPEELLAQAKKVKEVTGKDYLAADFSQFPIGVRLVLSLIWQQGSNIFDGDTATIDTPEALNAVKAITQLFDGGYANPKLNYADSQQEFLNGNAAVLVNGTWVVNEYTKQAENPDTGLKDYYVSDFPQLFDQPATWADNHTWAIPSTLKDRNPEKYKAALQVAAFIYNHDADWARTGHMAVRKSVLESKAYRDLPHRAEYVGTEKIARDTPASPEYSKIQDTLNRNLQSIWLTGKDPKKALAEAQNEVQDILDQ
ncbi:sugar ABC transporter substrate-binding protein [Thioclava nitratireducens]|uniref:Sugar ABC transporter substrate-binding protein n=1 Tax=Thioclava nitratireducens TaxID=1915078 RepID=A0ABN4X7A1_9RHOB|nr:extracellular solute-binding protein [Thioclava nitratireducens]AQS47094.1 sugar ABC transporter substrate-binding protein [Thioclava nitratireducens]